MKAAEEAAAKKAEEHAAETRCFQLSDQKKMPRVERRASVGCSSEPLDPLEPPLVPLAVAV